MSKEEILRHCVYNRLNGARYLLAYNEGELPAEFPVDPRESFGQNFFELVNMEIANLKKKPKHLPVRELVHEAIPELPPSAVIEAEADTKFRLYWVSDDRHESSWFVLVNVGAEETAQFIHAEFNDEAKIDFFIDDGMWGYGSLESFEVMDEIPLDKLNRDTIEYSRMRHSEYRQWLSGSGGAAFVELVNETFKVSLKTVDEVIKWTNDNLQDDPKIDVVHWRDEHKDDIDWINSVYQEIHDVSEILNVLKHNSLYAPVIADTEQLELLGFRVIDDGFISDRRMLLYNETLYVEGSMVVEVVKKLMC